MTDLPHEFTVKATMTATIISASLAFAEFLISAILAKKRKKRNAKTTKKQDEAIRKRMIALNDAVYELSRAQDTTIDSKGNLVSIKDGRTV